MDLGFNRWLYTCLKNVPFFCKYICPQGVLEGAIPLSIGNAAIRSALGKLFSFKCMLGDAMFYGSGAGKLPTASAVVADVVDMTKHQNTNIYID